MNQKYIYRILTVTFVLAAASYGLVRTNGPEATATTQLSTENGSLYIAEESDGTEYPPLYAAASASVSEGNPRTTATSQPDEGSPRPNGGLSPALSSSTQTSVAGQEPIEASAGIAVILKAGDSSYTAQVSNGSKVLDAMNAMKSQGLSFSGKQFTGLGFRVDAINGVQSDNGYYWFLYVNGKTSDLGASTMSLNDGDVIEWRYKNGY